jgi:hypothetical protein
LLLTACGTTTLQQHALVAQVTRDVIDQAGETVNASSHAAYVAHGGAAMPAADKAELSAHFDPIKSIYAAAVTAQAAYQSAILAADKAGDASLAQAGARALIDVWLRLDTIADQYGIHIVAPPAVLVRLGGTP